MTDQSLEISSEPAVRIEQPLGYIGIKIALGYLLLGLLSWLVTPIIGIVGVLIWMGSAVRRIEETRKGQPLGAIELGGALPLVVGMAAGALFIAGFVALIAYLALKETLEEFFRLFG